jgi:hypothetical protein
MITIDLFLEVFLAFCQMAQSVIHVLHFLLALKPLPMLATHVARNSIEYALESIAAGDLSLILQFQEKGNREGFYGPEL